jgi:hypothetical protein
MKVQHKKAPNNLYTTHGVGKSIKQRLAYWESTCPDGYHITHDPTDKQKVVVFEICWLVDHFPKDFTFC